MPFTTTGANKALDYINGKSNTAITPYLTLMSVMPTISSAGTEIAVTRQAAPWASAASRAASSNADVTFTGVPAGNVVAVAQYDASSAGNQLAWYANLQLVTNEAVTLALSLGKVANGSGGIANEVVKNSAESVTYVRGTDYEIQYDTGAIVAMAGGAITASQTLHITYYYPVTLTVGGSTFTFTISSGQLQIQLTGDK